MQGFYKNIHALRGGACLIVVMAHFGSVEAEFGPRPPLLSHVHWFAVGAVDIFFVVSGFIITSTNRKYIGHPAAVPGYLARRLWRVYPLYWAAAALCFAYLWGVFGVSRAVTPEMARGEWLWWLTLVPNGSENQLVGQAWTLSYEVMFYLAFGALMFAPPRVLAAGLGAWSAVVLAALARPVPAAPLAELVVSPFVLEFVGGCVVAWLAGRGACRGWWVAVAVAVGWATTGVVLTATLVPESYAVAMHSQRLRVLVFGPPAVLLLYAAVAAEGRWPRRVPKWLLVLGDVSYSLYMTHPIALAVGRWAGLVIPHTRLGHAVWVVGTLAGTVAFAVLFYRLVEKPLLTLGKRRPKPRPAEPVAELRRAA